MNDIEVREILALYRNLSPLAKLHMQVRLKRAYFDRIEKFVPKKGKILDFGCGHGFFSLYLAKKSSTRHIKAVDVAKSKISIAKDSKHSNRISFNHSRKTETFFNKLSDFDCIVVVNVLYLVPRTKQELLVQKAAQTLKQGGKLLIVEHNAEKRFKTLYTKIRELIMVRLLRLTYGEALTFNTHLWWMKLFREHFKNVTYRKLDPWGLQILYICTK